ncbi:MAG: AMP-binding protein [Pirellulales bacterium]
MARPATTRHAPARGARRRQRRPKILLRRTRHPRHAVGPATGEHYDVGPGDRVACLAGNRIEYIDLYFACGKLGAILVPLNHRLPAAGINELLDDCRPKLLVHETCFAEVVARYGKAVPSCRAG